MKDGRLFPPHNHFVLILFLFFTDDEDEQIAVKEIRIFKRTCTCTYLCCYSSHSAVHWNHRCQGTNQ